LPKQAWLWSARSAVVLVVCWLVIEFFVLCFLSVAVVVVVVLVLVFVTVIFVVVVCSQMPVLDVVFGYFVHGCVCTCGCMCVCGRVCTCAQSCQKRWKIK